MPQTYEQVIYEVDDPVATITLNRPEALNAWTAQMAVEVRNAVAVAERDPAVVGIVITGAGRGFCAGADMNLLSGLAGGDGDATATATDGLHATPGRADWGDDLRGEHMYLMSVPKPIVAAINGPVAGMGVPIALACDLRFMAAEAVLTTSFAQRGLVAEWGIAWLLPRLTGSAVALDLLFSGRKIDGAEAERLGLVNRVLPAAEVVAAAQDYVRELAARCSPTSMAVMKRQVYQQLHAGLGPAEREAQALMLESFSRPDFREGVQSYLEKRPPQFGRLEAEKA
jgi:enoyl-CoA hydratase/carnithine racemase